MTEATSVQMTVAVMAETGPTIVAMETDMAAIVAAVMAEIDTMTVGMGIGMEAIEEEVDMAEIGTEIMTATMIAEVAIVMEIEDVTMSVTLGAPGVMVTAVVMQEAISIETRGNQVSEALFSGVTGKGGSKERPRFAHTAIHQFTVNV